MSADAWAILKIVTPEQPEPLYKLFRGSYGGYTGSDTWDINSGIEAYDDQGDRVMFRGISGSEYTVALVAQGRLTGLMSSVLSSFQKQIAEVGGSIEAIDYTEFREVFRK